MYCPVCGENEDPIHVTSSEWACPNCESNSTPFEWISMTGDEEEPIYIDDENDVDDELDDDADFWADEDDYRGDPYADDDSDVETEQAHRAIDIEKRSQVGYDDIPF